MGMLETIQSGRENRPPRIMIYGSEGVGKSTFGASAPSPIFIQTEDGLGELDCNKFPLAHSLAEVLAQLTALRDEQHDFQTVVIDSADWLERLIFQISMVADISDENFGTSSGIALKYKLQAMSNLAKTKERKFNSGMNRRYMLIFSNPVSGMLKDDWVKVKPVFTRNFPANVLEETQIAGNLEGITSKRTQLGTLSIVDNVDEELKRIEEEEESGKEDAVMRRMFGGAADGQHDVLEEPGDGAEGA